LAKLFLKAESESFLKRQHPWIFSGAINEIKGSPAPGETIEIFNCNKVLCGRGAYSSQSQITVRMWSFNPGEEIDHDFFSKRIKISVSHRQNIQSQAYRLINAESDGLPGLIVDRYNDFLVCQFLSSGAEYWKNTISDILNELVVNQGIYERSDVRIREKEGLPQRKGILSGSDPPELIEIQEGHYKFFVDIKNGHKTGFYLDQRENRQQVAAYVKNKSVLNCFAYTGAFGIVALSAGAVSVTNIETSFDAVSLCNKNFELNKLSLRNVENIQDDVFNVLRKFRDSRRYFDVIILDPPKFAESRSQLKSASRGYKDVNLLALKLLNPGGILFTFSCSQAVEPDLFQKIVSDAALDARRELQIIRWLSQAPDHPVRLNFPQGRYLKGLVCRVTG
jgi:23S rRNA (cytosine1962-C5)-methyltransferase